MDDAGVEALLERLDSSLSDEDRRGALVELKLLVSRTSQAQLACGHIGLPVLLSILREDREDLELVRGALEALLQAVTRLPGHTSGVDASELNTELLGRDSRSVALLLELLEVDGAQQETEAAACALNPSPRPLPALPHASVAVCAARAQSGVGTGRGAGQPAGRRAPDGHGLGA